jgi:hypothetical protein
MMNVEQIAELAKKELDAAEANVEYAQRQLMKATERHARALEQYIDADLARNSSWNIMYSQLVQYKRAHDGDVLVLTSSNTTPEIKKLSKWVQNQRVHYKYYINGDTKHIKKHRIDALNKIGFIWNTNEHYWNVNYTNLQLYYNKYGHYNVSKRHDSKLYSYVTNLRRLMHKKKYEGIHSKELTEERICRLNSIHFTWDTTTKSNSTTATKCKTTTTPLDAKGNKFDELYTLLCEFKQAYGHVHVAKMMPLWRTSNKVVKDPLYKPEYKKLAPFLASVRSEQLLYMEGRKVECTNILDEKKIKLLTELGVTWKRPACEPRSKKNTKKRRQELISCSDGEGNNDSRDVDVDDVGGDDDNGSAEDGVDHVEEAVTPNNQGTIHLV